MYRVLQSYMEVGKGDNKLAIKFRMTEHHSDDDFIYYEGVCRESKHGQEYFVNGRINKDGDLYVFYIYDLVSHPWVFEGRKTGYYTYYGKYNIFNSIICPPNSEFSLQFSPERISNEEYDRFVDNKIVLFNKMVDNSAAYEIYLTSLSIGYGSQL